MKAPRPFDSKLALIAVKLDTLVLLMEQQELRRLYGGIKVP